MKPPPVVPTEEPKTPLTALLLTEQEADEYKKAVVTIERLKAARTVNT